MDRFCNLTWYWLTRNGDVKSVEGLRIRLWRPDPTDVDKAVTKGPWSPEAETEAFAKAKAAFGL